MYVNSGTLNVINTKGAGGGGEEEGVPFAASVGVSVLLLLSGTRRRSVVLMLGSGDGSLSSYRTRPRRLIKER